MTSPQAGLLLPASSYQSINGMMQRNNFILPAPLVYSNQITNATVMP
jgi:hypothetical protein